MNAPSADEEARSKGMALDANQLTALPIRAHPGEAVLPLPSPERRAAHIQRLWPGVPEFLLNGCLPAGADFSCRRAVQAPFRSRCHGRRVSIEALGGFDLSGLLFAALVLAAYNLWRLRHKRKRPG